MSSLWLVSTLQPVILLTGCSLASSNFVLQERFSSQIVTCLWFFRTVFVHLMSPLSCSLISASFGRPVSCLLSHRSRGLMSCMACLFASSIRSAGSPALSPHFQTVLPRPRVLLYVSLDSRSLQFRHWMTLWVAKGTSCCYALSGLLIGVWLVRSSSTLASQGYLSLCRGGRNRCHEAPFRLVSREDCRALQVKAHKVRKLATFLLFKRNCTVHQVLKARTWSSQNTFSAIYLRDVTHRHMETFFIGSVEVAQQVV